MGGLQAQIQWQMTAGGRSVLLDVANPKPQLPQEVALDEIAPEYRWVGRRWLRPALSGSQEPPSPLLTWWALLFALSMLARYHPAKWATALDRRQSPAAVELERAMDLAVEAVPHLVLNAIAPKPVLLPPFPSVPPLEL
jgi:hypothetical protein